MSKHRVERVFEVDLDAVLEKIDREGAELLRILDLPRGSLTSAKCRSCSGDTRDGLCLVHLGEQQRIEGFNLSRPIEIDRERLSVALPRYAVVYREVNGA